MADFKQKQLNYQDKQTAGVTKVDRINMSNSSRSLKEAKDTTLHIKEAAIVNGVDDDGDPLVRAFIIDENGNSYGTVSATAIRAIDDAIDLIDDGLKLDVLVTMPKSKNDRDFVSLTFTERN